MKTSKSTPTTTPTITTRASRGNNRIRWSSDRQMLVLTVVYASLLTFIVFLSIQKDWLDSIKHDKIYETIAPARRVSSPEMMIDRNNYYNIYNEGTENPNNHRYRNFYDNYPYGLDPSNPLAIPMGKAPNLPSIRTVDQGETMSDKKRISRGNSYGGTGDKSHLGGFTEFDLHGISPSVWKHMISNYGVQSVLDVGCGRGISTLWFLRHGVDILCAEGSHDAVEKTMLPNPETQLVEHDFSRGPWWPEKTYDAVWSVEFLEHVGRQFHFNYLTAFRKSALIFVTTSHWNGWHHVEVHDDDWWIRKYEAYGLRYDTKLTEEVRRIAKHEKNSKIRSPNGEDFNAQHIWYSMKVFVNPIVAALPQHAHLFPENGCYSQTKDKQRIYRVCGTGNGAVSETPLPPSYNPLNLTDAMDKLWEDEVKQHIKIKE